MPDISLLGAVYPDVPAVTLPKNGGGTATFYDGVDGNSLGYGYTDGSIPKVGIAKVGYAPVWDSTYTMMIFGTGTIGTGRVV